MVILTRIEATEAGRWRLINQDTRAVIAEDLPYGEASALQFYLMNPDIEPPATTPERLVETLRYFRREDA